MCGPSAPAAEQIVGELARAEVLFNPSKHRLRYASEPAAAADREFEAVVRDNDDNAGRLARVLAITFGMPYITRIERGTSWRLMDDGGPATEERLRWACDVLL